MANNPKTLTMSGGQEVLIDEQDYERFREYPWHLFNYVATTFLPDGRTVTLHRELMGNPKGLYVGFVDGNRLNCQRHNLFVFPPKDKRKKEELRLKALREWVTRDGGSAPTDKSETADAG